MKNKNVLSLLELFIFVLWVPFVSTPASPGEKKTVAKLPTDFVFSDKQAIGDLPEIVDLAMTRRGIPAFRKDEAAFPKDKLNSAIEDTLCWVKEMIQPQWLPDDLERRLIPIPGNMCFSDALWARYRIGKFAVQILSKYSGIIFIVCEYPHRSSSPPLDESAMASQMSSDIRRFLQKPETVCLRMPKIERHGDWFCSMGSRTLEPQSIDWFSIVDWYSNGRIQSFYLVKILEDKQQNYPKKHWFTLDEE